MKKTGLVLALTAAAMFVTGCATQAENSVAPAQPAPMAMQPANACKGMSQCKGVGNCKVTKKRVKHHRKHKVVQQTTSTTDSTATTATAPATDANSATSSTGN